MSSGRRSRRIAAGAGLSVGAALGVTATAQATDYTVTNLANTGTGSLRQAMLDSENGNRPTVDRILFQAGLSGTITLSSQGLIATEPLNVVGPGANVLTVSGGDGIRILDTEQGTAGDPVTISGLTLTHGYGTGNAGGGAIYSKNTDLTIESSTISKSDAGVVNSHVGGGIRQIGGNLLVSNSTISGNEGANGGAIHAFGADVGIENSTISGNTATGTGNGSGYGYGGGLWVDEGPSAAGSLVSYGSTIAGNHAYDGGGITAAAQTNGLGDTVVADNTATATTPHPDLRNASADPFKLVHSLVESTAGASIADVPGFTGSNILDVDPQLGPLANNGGPTQTEKPSLTSPLLDKGLTMVTPLVDQRGLTRPFDISSIANTATGDAADIGAVELQASDFATSPASPLPPPAQIAKAKCKKKKAKKHAVMAKKKCKKKRR